MVERTNNSGIYIRHSYYLNECLKYRPFHESDLLKISNCKKEKFGLIPEIRNVYFNSPLTCIVWKDGTKTFVKNADGDHNHDPEKALAMAISKKALGNKYKYYQEFEKWLPEEEKAKILSKNLVESTNELRMSFSSFKKASKECIDGRMGLTENPIEKAYLMLLKIKDDPESTDIDTVIGYLGEILDD